MCLHTAQTWTVALTKIDHIMIQAARNVYSDAGWLYQLGFVCQSLAAAIP
jgi:hypothetical protein